MISMKFNAYLYLVDPLQMLENRKFDKSVNGICSKICINVFSCENAALQVFIFFVCVCVCLSVVKLKL